MAWVRCCGGKAEKKALQFPPKDGWFGSGTATGITVGDSSLSCSGMAVNEYADFTKAFDGSTQSRTITTTFRCGPNTRQVFIYIDGVQATYETVTANTTKIITTTLPAGNHTVIFRMINGGWSASGGGYFDSILCA